MAKYESAKVADCEKIEKHEIPPEAQEAYLALKKVGFEAYFVGGCVRDILMGKKPKDWDITTNAKPEEIVKLYEKSFYENKYGTVSVVSATEDPTLKTIEITPYRVESKYSDQRHPDAVRFAEKLEEDLKRRDFTINALALDLESGKIIDFFGGREDLQKGIIKAVGEAKERFAEDALRMMRAVRLATELNFKLEDKTREALQENSVSLEMIAKERIRDELEKIMMASDPARGFELMREYGVLKYVMPELEKGFGVTQNKDHIFTVWDHNLRALSHAAEKGWSLEVRMGALLHDIAKPHTKRGDGPKSTFYGHDVVGGRMTEKALTRLKFPQKFVDRVSKLVRHHLFFSDTAVITLSAVRRVVRNVGPENIDDLMKVRFCDRIGMGRPKEQPFRLRKYQAMIEEVSRDPISVGMLNIDGERVMSAARLSPGPKIGSILNILLDEVLDDPKLNTEAYLLNKAQGLATLSDQDLAQAGMEAKKRSSMAEEEVIEEIEKKYHVK
ncbi:MAG: CCA tRNA nucleotidyltransferase [Candidatus Niyogibacteria bacterium]|nr:CCA tRNA nucleotidyltransferase [Candidatus Niyogibacteria bacterium]